MKTVIDEILYYYDIPQLVSGHLVANSDHKILMVSIDDAGNGLACRLTKAQLDDVMENRVTLKHAFIAGSPYWYFYGQMGDVGAVIELRKAEVGLSPELFPGDVTLRP